MNIEQQIINEYNSLQTKHKEVTKLINSMSTDVDYGTSHKELKKKQQEYSLRLVMLKDILKNTINTED